MNNQDQKPTITLAQWCAYLPYDIDIFLDTEGCLRGKCKVSVDNLHLVAATPLYKPLLRPMNQFNLLQINSLLSTIDVNIGYSLAGFYKIDFTHEMLELSVEELPYKVVQSLLKNHYDIFNLIPQGLALPIE